MGKLRIKYLNCRWEQVRSFVPLTAVASCLWWVERLLVSFDFAISTSSAGVSHSTWPWNCGISEGWILGPFFSLPQIVSLGDLTHTHSFITWKPCCLTNWYLQLWLFSDPILNFYTDISTGISQISLTLHLSECRCTFLTKCGLLSVLCVAVNVIPWVSSRRPRRPSSSSCFPSLV